MSPSVCLSCLSRSLASIERSSLATSSARRATFSTSPAFSAAGRRSATQPKAPSTRQTAAPTRGWLKVKKNPGAGSGGRPPAPGERKAIRKRVVLSNTNALEVLGLRDLDRRSADAKRLKSVRGDMLGLTNDTVDALRALAAFQPTQGWGLFRRPATLIRDQTVMFAEEIERIEASTAGKDRGGAEQASLVLFGERGVGKSVLQLQTMAVAQQKGWLMLHFPDAKDLTNGHTSYEPVTREDGGVEYHQPDFATQLLSNFSKANATLLSNLILSQQHDLPIPVQSNISLNRFADLGASDPSIAMPVWLALLKEITAAPQQGKGLQRPPLLVTLDGLDHIMRHSAYQDPNVKPIHAHDLTLVSSFIDLLRGHTRMQNGGLVLASTSASNRPSAPTMNHVIAETHAIGQNAPVPHWNPFAPLDDRIERALNGVQMHKVAGLGKQETRAVMEYYALSGMLRNSVTDALVAEKWSLSGGGIIGEVERDCVLQRI